MGADLHLHSMASDGLLAPGDLINRAAWVGLATAALTDHDTVAGLPGALAAAADRDLTLLPGVELSADDRHEGRERGIHILGYFFTRDGWRHPDLIAGLDRLRRARLDRLSATPRSCAMGLRPGLRADHK